MKQQGGRGDTHRGEAPEVPTAAPRCGIRARLFAWLLAHAEGSDRRHYGDRKRRLFADLGGIVLEIGAGTGPNAAYYPAGTRWLAVEPNGHMHRHLRKNAEQYGLALTILPGTAEALPVADESVDAVVSTLVLCSVESVERVLAEVGRVLRPGGRFVFVEHVAAEEGTLLRRAQHALRRPWGVLADGCRPDRDTGRILRGAGFAEVTLEHFRVPVGLVAPHIAGHAVKAPPSGVTDP